MSIQGVAFGGGALVYLRLSEKRVGFLQLRIPTRRDVGWSIGGLITLLVVVRVLSAIIAYLGFEQATNQIIEVGKEAPVVFVNYRALLSA